VENGGLREQTLDAAARLLAASGPDALTVRRIATEAGCSTRAIYHYFDGKDGVVDALYREGFARLNAALAAVPQTIDSLADLRGFSLAYRAVALRHPAYYEVMFRRPVRGYRPSPEGKALAASTYQLFIRAVQRCLADGTVDPGGLDAAEYAHVLWATAHGIIMLQLDELLPGGDLSERRYELALALLGR
jgi:AcrR family transcriptional regulator